MTVADIKFDTIEVLSPSNCLSFFWCFFSNAPSQVDPVRKCAAVVSVSDPRLLGFLQSEASALALLARVDPSKLVIADQPFTGKVLGGK